jgi:hypothetical protein
MEVVTAVLAAEEDEAPVSAALPEVLVVDGDLWEMTIPHRTQPRAGDDDGLVDRSIRSDDGEVGRASSRRHCRYIAGVRIPDIDS